MSLVEKRVSKAEFDEFVKNYPRKLVVDVCGISAPPLISYNDFTLGKWSDSIVARTWAWEDDPNHYFYKPEEDRAYFIRVEEGENDNV